MENKYYSQCGEDRWIDENIKLPKRGTFVDVGAGNAQRCSNTKFLEDRGWSGLCIDADPINIRLLKEGRKCEVVRAFVSDKVETRQLRLGDEPYLTGLKDYGAKTRGLETIETSMLKDLVGGVVDYLSIDVEGNELEVCKGMDWGPPPRVVIVEYNVQGNTDTKQGLLDYFSKLPYKLVYETEVNLIFESNATGR